MMWSNMSIHSCRTTRHCPEQAWHRRLLGLCNGLIGQYSSMLAVAKAGNSLCHRSPHWEHTHMQSCTSRTGSPSKNICLQQEPHETAKAADATLSFMRSSLLFSLGLVSGSSTMTVATASPTAAEENDESIAQAALACQGCDERLHHAEDQAQQDDDCVICHLQPGVLGTRQL